MCTRAMLAEGAVLRWRTFFVRINAPSAGGNVRLAALSLLEGIFTLFRLNRRNETCAPLFAAQYVESETCFAVLFAAGEI